MPIIRHQNQDFGHCCKVLIFVGKLFQLLVGYYKAIGRCSVAGGLRK